MPSTTARYHGEFPPGLRTAPELLPKTKAQTLEPGFLEKTKTNTTLELHCKEPYLLQEPLDSSVRTAGGTTWPWTAHQLN